ncbi:non-ribosomal peptide synthetase [Paenibacillus brasilensis]|uniref:Amino acid adenylation domain-containing protein/non-ribosomal peptide synthase protein (TIGR01720 family) n=1 Tax=Paenibacillus brasilensis TaxID=128574 RepID=A0ABU0KTR0_9BACL|nr:non-ribosomal peptide synthetase [Paenibacillus brasilensis]MDQ0492826.1 amino acid adenylation domain-containing protein/non-ribosomal peptide synthase protein (TIGR01720 family) [Paenibacillus brasilensis]
MENLGWEVEREGQWTLPASSAQQRLWTIQQLTPGSNAYNVPFLATFKGKLDITSLEQSLRSLTERHCVLRSSFRLISGELVQVIEKEGTADIKVEIVQDEAELQSKIEQEVGEPFVMDHPPLFRMRLFVQSLNLHRLVLTFHHSIFDGWSASVFFEELTKTYVSLTEGLSTGLVDLELKYKNYFKQEKNKFRDNSLDSQAEYWKKQLSGELPKLLLPTDKHRTAVQARQQGGVYTYGLTPELSRTIKAFAKQQKTSLFVTLLTCFKTLLYRYTQQTDLLIGIPYANRNHETVSDLIGFLVNTLVIRTSVCETSGFREYLSQVHTAAMGAYSHSDLPFDAVVKALQPEREGAISPLIQVLFNQREYRQEMYKLPQVSLEVEELSSRSPQFELVFNVCDLGDSIRIIAEYDAGLFRANSIGRLVRQFAVLAESATSDPEASLVSLRLTDTESVAAEEIHNVPMIRFSGTSTSLHKLFEAQVERAPQAIAVEYNSESLTYGELNIMANHLANHLRDRGVTRNTLVGLGTDRSPALVVGILGILKAGAAYVPMDPAYPADRLQYLMEDSGVPFLVVQDELLVNFPCLHTVPISINPFMSVAEDKPGNPELDSSSEDSAYVIYTSGSTGKPKGCLIRHRNVIRLFESTQSWYQFDSRDVWTLFHSYSFDFSVWEFWGALLYGGRLVIVPSETTHSPGSFLNLLIQKKVTVLNQTPSAFWPLMDAILSSESKDRLKLRGIIFGGEKLEFERLAPWYRHFEENIPQLINMYGITETTVHNTFRRIIKADTTPGSISRIGEPLPDLKLYVLDEHLNPVAEGIPGELYVSGPGVSEGYLHRSALTEERFLPNPFHKGEHGCLYRTGDQVRQVANKDYEYWGRLDAQVKIRGYRIELSEIEAAIRGLAGVKAAVVIPHTDEDAPPRLIAYVVTNDPTASTAEMHKQIRQTLPSFMTPSFFVEVSSIPVTPNGKVDKSLLPAPVLELDTEDAYVAASSPLEQQLVEIWSQVLGVQTVGVEHNFFQIGGDSIRCIQLVSLAQKKGIDLKVEQIFQFPTIRELSAQFLSDNRKHSAGQTYEPFSQISSEERAILQEEAVDAYPLTMLQQGMVFHSEYSPEEAMYYVLNSLLIRADYDGHVLEKSLNILVKRHDILRTTISMEGFKEPLQIVMPYTLVSFYEYDIREQSPVEQENYIRIWWQQEVLKLDLSHGPVFTLTAHRRSDKTFQLSLCTHHALIDGWSVASFFTELLHTYVFLLKNPEEALSQTTPLSVRFAEYASMEQALLQSQECREFWQEWLEDCSIAKVPRLALKSEPTSIFSDSQVQELPKPLLTGLDHFCRAFNVPLRSVLLAAHLKIMSLLTGEHDVTTGVVYNGRPETIDGDKVLGLFLNTLPFRYKLEHQSWIDFVQSLWVEENRLLPYRRYPLSQIMQDHGGASLFETLFNYTHFHVYNEFDNNKDIAIMESNDYSAPIYPLVVDFFRDVASDTLRLALVWDCREFERIQIESMMNLYIRTLAEIARTPHLSSLSVPKLTENERQTILYEWNRCAEPSCKFTPVHQMFERQVVATPDKTAVVDGNIRISYEDLNQKANSIAHSLNRSGSGTNSLVGIMLYKSWEAVAAILGVLKAGGAYVPLDPDYPQERLDHMITESAIKVLITDQASILKENSGIRILSLKEALACEDYSNPVHSTADNQLAYVIFTSGSTGKPKGAMNTQIGLSMAYDAWNKAYDLRNIGCNLQMTSFAFDVFTADVFRTLCSGGKLLLCPQECLMNAPEMHTLMVREQVDFGFFLPAVMRNLVWYLEEGNLKLTSVKVIIVGADYWFPHEYNNLQKVCGPATRVINSYGVAEATVDSIYFEGEGSRILEQGNIPIGRPFANMSSYILTPDLEPLYPGIIGELYIGGSCVGQGYINRPELTEEKFVDSPFVPGERLYRTGDLGRYWPDGNIEFIGRRDHQLKVRGYRVELGEIESALRSVMGVKDAVVISYESEPSLFQLQAYLVFVDNSKKDIQLVKKELKRKLPDYMMPNTFFLLDQMPLNPNGKIDRNRVAASGGTPIKTEVPYILARNKTELLLTSIFTAILGTKRISVLENIFDIGADSLAALKILARIRAKLQIELTLKTLFTNPTIAELAREITGYVPASPALTLERTDIQPYAPLSYAQQRIWFFESLQPGTGTYHVPVILKFTGPLDFSILENSLRKLVERHDALRTTFQMSKGHLIQTVLQTDFELRKLKLEDYNEQDTNKKWQQKIAGSVKHPFRLNEEALFRAELIRVESEVNLLIITMHHMITDGWSVDILIHELSQLYNAGVGKTESYLPDLKFRYTDFASWQRKIVEGGDIQNQVEYWTQKLRDVTDVLQLPLDFPRPAEKSYRGAAETLELPLELMVSLQELAQEKESTLFIILLSAYFVLLARYSGQEDIVVGTPVTNRSHEELEHLVGLFVNTLAIRSTVSGDLSFLELIAQVKMSLLEALDHSDLPFEHLVSVLNPERKLSLTPLFQTMFLMEQPTDLPEFNGVRAERVPQDGEASKCDISLSVSYHPERLTAIITYDPDLFLPSTIRKMLENFGILLQSITENPKTVLNGQALVAPSQFTELIYLGSGNCRNYEENLCLHDLFTRQAMQTPESIACVCEDVSLTYEELNRKSDQLARFLRRMGIGVETFVGVYMESSVEMVIGLLGILKAGGAFVPLEPSMPVKRIHFILEDSSVSLIVSQSLLSDKLDCYCPIVNVDKDWSLITNESMETRLPDMMPGSAAYILYTTGSTGQPKGVVVEHKQIINYVLGISETLQLAECSTFAMVQPLAVDSCQTVLFPAFCSGGTLHLVTRELALNAPGLAEYFSQNPIDCLKIAPSHLQALQNLSSIQAFMPRKRLILGGEASNSEWIRELLKHKGVCQIYNHYGPTETTVGVSTFYVQSENNLTDIGIPVGYPLPNIRFYIVDPSGCLVPKGVVGELWVGGAAVTREYLNQGCLTREKYSYTSFEGMNGERVYRTGDRVRMLQDGAIEFLGRLDDQVKINGYRVEPAELTRVLSELLDVREVVVLPKTLQDGAKHLVAYLVRAGVNKPSDEKINAYILRALPSYFLPYAYIWMDELPRTLQGKINRSALPEVETRTLPEKYHTPQNEVEKELADIWSNILDQERIGIYDNFFRLGGDSILSMQLIAQAHSRGWHLTLKHLFQYQTIAELAWFIRQTESVAHETETNTDGAPLSPMQAWFFEHQSEHQGHWNQSLLLELDPSLSYELLDRAVSVLIQHHPALRTRFVQDRDHQWIQETISDTPDYPVAIVNLQDMDAEEAEEALAYHAKRYQQSVSHTRSSMYSMIYFYRGERGRSMLLIILHHLIVDGVSWRILTDDLQTVCGLLLTGQEPKLPAATSPFQVWAKNMHEQALKLDPKQELEQWNWLRDEKIPSLPINSILENTERYAETITVALEPETTDLLIRTAPVLWDVHVNAVLLAVLTEAYQQWSGYDCLVVDLESHGRGHSELDLYRTIGWFTTHLPVLLKSAPDGIRSTVRYIDATLKQADESGWILGWLKYAHPEKTIRRKAQMLPQPGIKFNYLDQFNTLSGGSLLTICDHYEAEDRSSESNRSHPICIDMMVTNNRLRMQWTYSKEQSSPEDIQLLADAYIRLAVEVSKNIRSLAKEEVQSDPLLECRHPSLVPFNGAGVGKPLFFCVHPITGNVHSYLELAQMIQSRYRFVGIQAPSLDEPGLLFDDMTDMALYYIEGIQTVQPHGPYYLGGWSMGGMVAFEMARLLQMRREEVKCLVIMDKDAFRPRFANEAEYILAYLFEEGIPTWEEKFLGMNASDRLNWLLTQDEVRKRYGNNDSMFIRRHLELLLNHIHMLWNYAPQPYNGSLLIVSAANTVQKTGNDPALGWSKLAADLQAETIPGDHYSFIQKPHVEQLAERILNYLPEAKEVNR